MFPDIHDMKNYINETEFRFELIICKGRGIVSDKLSNMLWLISTNLIKRPIFQYTSYKEDQVMEGYTRMLEMWRNVEIEKYINLLPYFTEIAKRAFTKIFNTYKDKQQKCDAPSISYLESYVNY